MNWQMLTAIGQLAAVLFGIPSLIYFAIQIREQTRERRQSAVNALTVQWGDLTKALHENAEFTALFLRFEGMYYSRREGILSPELWEEIDRTMSDFLAYDGIRQWWETRRHWHTEAFARVVDAIIARGNKPTAYSSYNLDEIVQPRE